MARTTSKRGTAGRGRGRTTGSRRGSQAKRGRRATARKSVNPRTAAAAKKGWETRRKNAGKTTT
jgi:hypothetical protein